MSVVYKTCPNCQNAAALEAPSCVRCGRPFKVEFIRLAHGSPPPQQQATSVQGAPLAPGRPSYVLQVSGLILNWPNCCACCGGASETSLPVRSMRTTGIRVVHADTREWYVPYCADCVQHATLAQDADRIASQAEQVRLETGCMKSVSGCFLCFLGFLGFVLVACLNLPLALAVVLAWLGWKVFETRRREKNAAREDQVRLEQREAMLEEAELAMLTDCCTVGPAVTYHGWSGSVHTFTFYSHRYAAAFKQCNASKLLG